MAPFTKVISLSLLCSLSAVATPLTPVKPAPNSIDADQKTILVLEKDENPQNILMVYTKVDSSCHFQVSDSSKEPSTPVLDFYWLMNRTTYKPVHPLIKSGARERLELIQTKELGDTFFVRLNDFKELKNDLPSPQIKVSAFSGSASAGKTDCEVEATLRLGPSDHGALMILKSVYAESKHSLLPPFRKLVSLTLTGVDAVSGSAMKRKYWAQ